MSATDRSKQPSVLSFKYSASGTARSMPAYDDGSTPTLITGKPPAVMLKLRHTGSSNMGRGGEGAMWGEDVSYTLSTQQDQTMFEPRESGYVVRRLTPVECERLQGFPDGWTDLAGADPEAIASRMPQWADADDRGKRALVRKVEGWCADTPDGPRYKACGNSMAVPNMRWIFERIAAYDTLAETPVG